jgi:1-acyl-sn-glycerol-3-phosphate acyltransferase
MPGHPRAEKSGLVWFFRQLLRVLVFAALRMIYRIRVVGRENLPADGAALLVSNHVSYIDAILIGAAAVRRWVRFVILREFLDQPFIGHLVRFFDAVPVSSTRAREAMRTTIDALKQGDVVCIFPEGQLTRHGLLNPLKKGFEMIARGADCVVVPVWLDDVWGSIFSFERRRYFSKRPRYLPYHLSVYFGEAIPSAQATTARIELALRELSTRALGERDELRSSLDFQILAALRKKPRHPCFLGHDRVWSRAEVLAVTSRLAERWKHLRQRVVPVVLPTGVNAALANIALVLAGKIPMNVERRPPSASAVINADVFAEAIAALSPLELDARRLVARWPVDWFQHRRAAEGAAVIIANAAFTHRSLLAQLEQIEATNLMIEDDVLVTREPLHTAAGSLLGLWYPLLHGVPIAFGDAAQFSGSRIFLGNGAVGGTVPALMLRSGINFLSVESIPAIVTISQSDPPLASSTSEPQPGAKEATVGRLLPGFVPAFDGDGQLLVRGPAVPGSDHEFAPTGVRGQFDEDGMFVSSL